MIKKHKPLILTLLPFIGLAVILAGVGFAVYFEIGRIHAVENVPRVLEQIKQLIPESGAGVVFEPDEGAMLSLSVDSKEYCGILTYKDGSAYPVYRSGDTTFSKNVPYRQGGNPTDGGFVIGSYVSEDYFQFVTTCDVGDAVAFQDVLGRTFNYNITQISHNGKAGKEVIPESEDDLVIFGRPRGGIDYVILHCRLSQSK